MSTTNPNPANLDPAPARVEGQTFPYPGCSVSALVDGTDVIRRAMATRAADTWFSIPARASIGGRKVAGFLTTSTLDGSDVDTPDDPALWIFRPLARERAHVLEHIPTAVLRDILHPTHRVNLAPFRPTDRPAILAAVKNAHRAAILATPERYLRIDGRPRPVVLMRDRHEIETATDPYTWWSALDLETSSTYLGDTATDALRAVLDDIRRMRAASSAQDVERIPAGTVCRYLQWSETVTVEGPAPDGPHGPWYVVTDHAGRTIEVDHAGLSPVDQADDPDQA